MKGAFSTIWINLPSPAESRYSRVPLLSFSLLLCLVYQAANNPRCRDLSLGGEGEIVRSSIFASTNWRKSNENQLCPCFCRAPELFIFRTLDLPMSAYSVVLRTRTPTTTRTTTSWKSITNQPPLPRPRKSARLF